MPTASTALQLYNQMPVAINDVADSMNSIIEPARNLERLSGNLFNIIHIEMTKQELNYMRSEINQINNEVQVTNQELNCVGSELTQIDKAADNAKKTSDLLTKSLCGAKGKMGEVLTEANNYQAAGNLLQVQTGMQGNDLEMAKGSIKSLYIDNMGESLEDAARSLAAVHQLTNQTGEGLELMTRAGILMRDSFGYDISDSIYTAQMLEKQFGISGVQAMDLIMQATQAGLNQNGNLLSTINENAEEFKKLGFNSAEMFTMLVNGAEDGITSVDKLGAAVKEFSARAASGSESTKNAFSGIGLDPNEMTAQFAQGGDPAKQAFLQTVNEIGTTEDPMQQNMAGESLFGNMWGELGYEGIMALANLNGEVALTTQNLEALNNVRYDNATSALSSLGRTINMGLAGVIGDTVTTVTAHINDFTTGLQGDASNIQGIFGGIGLAIGFIGNIISEGWSIISPILLGVLAIMGIYLLLTEGIQKAQLVGKAVMAAYSATQTFLSIGFGILRGNTAAASAATLTYNSALLACPITWIIIAIIALIAVIYAGVAMMNHFAGTTVSAAGVIVGAFFVMGANVINLFINVWNRVAMLVNFICNLFINPIAAVQILFLDMAGNVIDCVLNMAKAVESIINKIPGVEISITAGLEDFKSKIEAASEKIKTESEWKEIAKKKEFIDYGDAYQNGYNMGEGLENKIKGAFDDPKSIFDGMENPLEGLLENPLGGGLENNPFGLGGGGGQSIPQDIGATAGNTGATAGNTAAMADSMTMLDEDLEYLRDLAEQEVINRFTTAELTVNMGGITNQVNSNMDLDGIGHYLEGIIFERLETAAEGVY